MMLEMRVEVVGMVVVEGGSDWNARMKEAKEKNK
jgi:hypothetical protein